MGTVPFAAAAPFVAGSLVAGRVVDRLGWRGTSITSDLVSAAARLARMEAPTVEAVATLLTTRLGPGVEAVERLPGGAWSQVFAARHHGRRLIVRFSEVVGDFRNDERASRHRSPVLPIPRIHQIGEAYGGYFAISDRHDGVPLEQADGPAMRRRLPSVFAALDAMRTIDISDSVGYGGWDADGDGRHTSWAAALVAIGEDHANLRTHGWSARLSGRPLAERACRTARAELRSLAVDLPDARHLVHSDLLDRNVLVRGERITAVLDWGSALYGDHVFDLAWLTFWRPRFSSWARVDVLGEARRHFDAIGLRIHDFERRHRACELYIALDGIAYLTWAGRWDALDWTARRALEVAERR